VETLLIILGILLLIAGLAGCVIPVIPGPALSFLALVVLQLLPDPPFTSQFMLIWAAIVLLVTVLDYVAPVYGAKRYGGTRWGVNGSIVGVILGFLLIGPVGLIIGPFIGAYIGELIAGIGAQKALRAAYGTFVGFLAGTFVKIIVALIITYHFINAFV
jgi:uncharacterized protein